MPRSRVARGVVLLVPFLAAGSPLFAQKTLEQRQPLELLFADSIVPQDRHELMSTTGMWHTRDEGARNKALTQKIEWGISDQLQIAAFAPIWQQRTIAGARNSGFGDLEIGARFSWPRGGSDVTHIAVALDAGLPTGNLTRGLGSGTYAFSPSVLLSRELKEGAWQVFSTTGVELVARRRHHAGAEEEENVSFSNDGVSFHIGPGWAVGEVQWIRGDRGRREVSIAPSYVWRLARRCEFLVGFPMGITDSAERLSVVAKFTFELGGDD